MLGIDDAYVAYCLDEACWYITTNLKENHVPIFPDEKKIPGKGQFSNMYSQLGVTR